MAKRSWKPKLPDIWRACGAEHPLDSLKISLTPSAIGKQVAEPPKRDPGLFETYLKSPAVLYEDMVHHPTKYREEDRDLVAELVAGRKMEDLGEEERTRLDQMVFDFLGPEPQPKTPPPPPRRPEEDEEEGEEKVAALDPEPEFQDFWWLKA